MDDLQRLLAVEEIRQLKARYFRCVDTKQWAEWREVFTDDAVLRVDNFTASEAGQPGNVTDEVCGADAIVGFARERLQPMVSVHSGPNGEIEILSDSEAAGVWAMRDILVAPDGSVHGGFGHYHERYRKEGGRWRIAETRVSRLLWNSTLA